MRPLVTLALVSCLALTACSAPSGGTSSAPPASSASPNSASATSAATVTSAPADTGARLSGDGYTLTLPRGWVDATAAFKEIQTAVDTGGKDSTDKSAFADNVNVVVQDSAEYPLEQLKQQLTQQMQSAGSTNIEFKQNVQLDGTTALQVWSVTKVAKNAHTIQFLAFARQKIYVLTVSTDLSRLKADDLAQSVVSGWAWA